MDRDRSYHTAVTGVQIGGYSRAGRRATDTLRELNCLRRISREFVWSSQIICESRLTVTSIFRPSVGSISHEGSIPVLTVQVQV